MKIRNEQLEPFRRRAINDFEERAIAHLRRQLSEQTRAFTDDDLLARVRSCMSASPRYGFVSERHIISFIDTTYLIGDRFDTDPRHRDIVEVMLSKELDADRRAGLMLGLAYGRYTRTNMQEEI